MAYASMEEGAPSIPREEVMSMHVIVMERPGLGPRVFGTYSDLAEAERVAHTLHTHAGYACSIEPLESPKDAEDEIADAVAA